MQYILPPVLPRCATVLTVHDISFEHVPGVLKRTELIRAKLLIPLSARRADVVVTVSEFTRRTWSRHTESRLRRSSSRRWRLPPDFGCWRTAHLLTRCAVVIHIEGPFILYVGNIQPRKNLVRLVQAYAALASEGHLSHRLVIVGKREWNHSPVLEAARASGLEERITFTGYVADEDLCALYNAADLFVFPSIFEGFGSPIVEAMSCGTPVITSNTSSMPEVGGDAAVYVDPFNVAELVLAMRTVLEGRRPAFAALGAGPGASGAFFMGEHGPQDRGGVRTGLSFPLRTFPRGRLEDRRRRTREQRLSCLRRLPQHARRRHHVLSRRERIVEVRLLRCPLQVLAHHLRLAHLRLPAERAQARDVGEDVARVAQAVDAAGIPARGRRRRRGRPSRPARGR